MINEYCQLCSPNSKTVHRGDTDKVVWLEKSWKNNRYYKSGTVKEDESQGCFPFHRRCANLQLAQTKREEAQDQKIDVSTETRIAKEIVRGMEKHYGSYWKTMSVSDRMMRVESVILLQVLGFPDRSSFTDVKKHIRTVLGIAGELCK